MEYDGPENDQFIASYKEFDWLNRVTAEWIQDAQGNSYKKTSYVYDVEGNIIEKIADKNRTLTRYNFHGDPIETVDALGHVTRWSYGYPKHPTIETTDPLGRRIKNSYDTLGRRISEEHFNPLGILQQKIEFRYDAAGNRTEIVQVLLPTQAEKVTKCEFDSLSRPIACIEAAGSAFQRREETHYDINGNIIEILKSDGLKLSYQYDAKNRLTSFSSSDGSIHYSYEYDAQDNWIKCEDHVLHQTTERAYDTLNHLLSEKLGNGLTLHYQQDGLGRLLTLTLPDSSKIERVYEGPCLTQVKRLSSTDELIYEHHYAAYSPSLKPLKTFMSKQAGFLEYAYDSLDRVTKITSQPYQESIAYDPVGNIIQRTAQNCENNYTYSDLDQLLVEHDHSYAYNALNDQIAKDNQTFTVNLLNQLSDENHKYDLRGNCIKENDNSYHYDALDRLIFIETPTHNILYTYDVENRRLSKSLYNLKGDLLSCHRYLYQKNYEIGSYNNENTLQELRILGLQTKGDIGSAIAFELSGKTLIPLHDSLGNLICALDPQDGTPLESFDYSAFSEEVTSSQIPWRFASKRTDPESGLIYFGHRYYNPATSRWLTQDPLRLASSLNLYNFCKNNPIRYYDPDGRFVVVIPWAAIAALETLTGAEIFCLITATLIAAFAEDGCRYLSEKADEFQKDKDKEKKKEKNNTNPYNGSVDEDVMLVDSAGNVIPVKKGEQVTGSRDGDFIQVRDKEGKYTGLRKDGAHNSVGTNDDPRHLKPHAHVPNITNSDGTPWLPIYH